MSRTLDPTIISPSRLSAFAECGIKYQFRYVDGIRPPRQGSRILFGNVMHKARQWWAEDRSSDMVSLVRAAWTLEAQKDKPLAAFLAAYTPLSIQARAVKAGIMAARPELKVVNASKDWKEHPLCLQIDELVEQCSKMLVGSVYDFGSTDPLPSLYDESIKLGADYAAKWRHLPNGAAVELGFTIPWRGFTITGRIDEVLGLTLKRFGPANVIVDAKTHREDPFAPKLLDQGIAYTEAVPVLCERGQLTLPIPGAPLVYAVDAMRLLSWRFFTFDDRDLLRYQRQLERYKRGVQAKAFMANTARCDAKMCGYRGICEAYHQASELLEDAAAFNGEELAA